MTPTPLAPIVGTLKSHRRHFLKSVAGAASLVTTAFGSRADRSPRRFLLADSGRPKASILLPEDASPTLRFAAEELRRYVSLISSASLPIQINVNGAVTLQRRVVLGRPHHVRAISTEIDPIAWPGDGSDDFTLTRGKDTFVLCGGSDRAVLYGVYHVLEQLGCRWLLPGEDYIPRTRTLAFAGASGKISPALKWRILFVECLDLNSSFLDWFTKQKFNVLFLHPLPTVKRLSEQHKKEIELRGISLMSGGHVPVYFLPIERYSAEHPEWFSLIRARRVKPGEGLWKICHSNDQALRVFIQNCIDFLRSYPAVKTIAIWENDGYGGWCECAACRALEPDPDRIHPATKVPDRSVTYMRFVKKVADGIRKELPDRRVSFGPYYNTTTLPANTGQLPTSDGLLMLDDYHQCYRHSLTEPCNRPVHERMASDWLPHFPESFAWVYYHSRVCGIPVGLQTRVKQDMHYLRQRGIMGFLDCVTYLQAPDLASMFAQEGLNFYALAKLSWNPELSTQTIIEDFTRHAYGAAAQSMQRFYGLLDETTHGFGQGRLQPDEKTNLKYLHTAFFMSPRQYIPTRVRLNELKKCLTEATGRTTDALIQSRIEPLLRGIQVAELLWEAEKAPLPQRIEWLAKLRPLANPYLGHNRDPELMFDPGDQKYGLRTRLQMIVDGWEEAAEKARNRVVR